MTKILLELEDREVDILLNLVSGSISTFMESFGEHNPVCIDLCNLQNKLENLDDK